MIGRAACVSRAPIRVDWAGGGTDAPPFSAEYGGNVLNCAIRRYAYARLEIRGPSDGIELQGLNLGHAVRADSVERLEIDGTLNLLKGVARRMAPSWGFRLTVHADVPPGSGLGSSGAVGVACVDVFAKAMGLKMGAAETALLANEIERVDLGFAGGSQDSFPPALGGFNLLTYFKGGAVSHRPIELGEPVRHELQRRVVLVHTGEVHLSGSIHKDIREDYESETGTTRDAMHNLARVAREAAAALEAGDLKAFGRCMDENWIHHQRLHPSCNCDQLRKYYDATAELVDGAKTCGAGGGGIIAFLSKDECRLELESVCRDLGGRLIPFLVDESGVSHWNLNECPE